MLNLVVPTGWKLTKLSDLGEVNRGRSRHRPRDAKHLYGGSYPFVQTGDVKASGGRINSYTQTYSEAGLAQSRLWPKGTMCITIAANIAETGILEFPACFPDSVIGFIPDPTKCNVYFIEYVFRFLRKRIQAQATGSVQDNINLQTLELLEFPVPEVEEQNRIASILCKFDDKIHLNTQTNQTLESIAQAIFKSWFVDFEPVKAKMATLAEGGTREQAELAAMGAISGLSTNGANAGESELAQLQQQNPEHYQQLAETAALFPSAMVESELGEIPEGWEVKNIENILELAYGKSLGKTERIDGNIRVYGSGGLTGWHNKYLVNGPGIIVGRKGTVGSIYWEKNNFFPIDTVFYVTPKNGIPLIYTYYLLQILGLENMNTDAAVPGLNRNNVYRLETIFSSANLINAFSRMANSLQNEFDLLLEQSSQLCQLRDSILPKLLSGEIDLNKDF